MTSPTPSGWLFPPAEIIQNVQNQHYARLAAMVIVLYDTLITLDREIEYFWGKPWSHVKTLYFLNRYWGMIALGLDTWSRLFRAVYIHLYVLIIRAHIKLRFYQQSRIISADFNLFSRAGADGYQFCWSKVSYQRNASVLIPRLHSHFSVILMIRVHALYNRSRIALVVLTVLLVVQATAMAALLISLLKIFHVISFTSGTTCGSFQTFPRWFALFWLPAVLIDLLLLLLTLYKAFYFLKMTPGKRLSSSRLFETLVRDQILYFVGVLFVASANMVAVSLMPLLICVAVGFVLAFPLIMGSRLLLNLREMADDRLESNAPTISTLIFAPGQPVRSEHTVPSQSTPPAMTPSQNASLFEII
ncbi:hypothetical protein DFH11DRAFT_1739582 [Phellopilus nigrolimitatus]|nr:hypothetical protein DFH11DRAFT_1739582 [Phellopilus nigrolimitatus]